ncbi:MAG: DNA repair protein RadC [Thermoflexales bacterium]|nr:DNA repair protein RadC [Thermoflexales bacterium]
MYYQLSLFGNLQEDTPVSLKVLREKPGDRVLEGVTGLPVLELLSAMLGNPDTALRVLDKFPTVLEIVKASSAELQSVKGVGKHGAKRIRAGIEMGRRLMVDTLGERPQVKCPADAANLLMGEMSLLEQEHMRVVLLDTRNRIQGIHTVYQGSLNTTAIRVCELFREAVRTNSAAIIVAHNHPSGDPSPSPEDVAVTKQVVEVGKLMDIDVLDHLIVGSPGRWLSLRERGLGFS